MPDTLDPTLVREVATALCEAETREFGGLGRSDGCGCDPKQCAAMELHGRNARVAIRAVKGASDAR